MAVVPATRHGCSGGYIPSSSLILRGSLECSPLTGSLCHSAESVHVGSYNIYGYSKYSLHIILPKPHNIAIYVYVHYT